MLSLIKLNYIKVINFISDGWEINNAIKVVLKWFLAALHSFLSKGETTSLDITVAMHKQFYDNAIQTLIDESQQYKM